MEYLNIVSNLSAQILLSMTGHFHPSKMHKKCFSSSRKNKNHLKNQKKSVSKGLYFSDLNITMSYRNTSTETNSTKPARKLSSQTKAVDEMTEAWVPTTPTRLRGLSADLAIDLMPLSYALEGYFDFSVRKLEET